MPRTLFDSPYIFGIHEPGGERHMLEAGKPGWIVFTEGIGSEANDRGGKDFTPWSRQSLGIICRINNGYYPGGTIPHSSRYESFAKRCANFVAASQGCKIWIIGNEMNHPVERPGVSIDWSRTVRPADPVSWGRYVPWRFNALDGEDGGPTRSRMAVVSPGEPITPELYARCYKLCRDAIHRVAGHENDQVLVGAAAPWNTLTPYSGNPSGDWVQYHADILRLIGPEKCDGITIHAYTHSASPDEVHNDFPMGPPFQQYQFNFRTYRDFMWAIPSNMRHLPVYCTETDQDVPWENRNSGWVKRAYGEIDHWNRQPGHQQIRALILYRWPNIDRWVIEGKQGVIEDFREAMRNEYRWLEQPLPLPQPDYRIGDTVYTTQDVNVREKSRIQDRGRPSQGSEEHGLQDPGRPGVQRRSELVARSVQCERRDGDRLDGANDAGGPGAVDKDRPCSAAQASAQATRPAAIAGRSHGQGRQRGQPRLVDAAQITRLPE